MRYFFLHKSFTFWTTRLHSVLLLRVQRAFLLGCKLSADLRRQTDPYVILIVLPKNLSKWAYNSANNHGIIYEIAEQTGGILNGTRLDSEVGREKAHQTLYTLKVCNQSFLRIGFMKHLGGGGLGFKCACGRIFVSLALQEQTHSKHTANRQD